MKSKYWLYGILALAIIGVIVISGCIQQQTSESSPKEEWIQISQDNFYLLELRMQNSDQIDYEKNPHWCYNNPLYADVTFKYKLVDIPEEYHKAIRCKVYDGATLLTDKKMIHYVEDPEGVRRITTPPLARNKDHDLTLCFHIYDYDDFDQQDKAISNEVCLSQRVNKEECDRNLEWEEHRPGSTPPPYFTE